MKMKIARNDIVEVIAGEDKGKRGRVLRVLRDENRVVVEKVHLVKRHQRQSRQGVQSGIVEKEAAVSASNVKLVERSQSRGTVTPTGVTREGNEPRAAKEPKATKPTKEPKAAKEAKTPKAPKESKRGAKKK